MVRRCPLLGVQGPWSSFPAGQTGLCLCTMGDPAGASSRIRKLRARLQRAPIAGPVNWQNVQCYSVLCMWGVRFFLLRALFSLNTTPTASR